MENHGHGLIIRQLRLTGLSVRATAQKIDKSIGWLSEIENGTGTARLTEGEFNRIVDVLDGAKHRAMFRVGLQTIAPNHKIIVFITSNMA